MSTEQRLAPTAWTGTPPRAGISISCPTQSDLSGPASEHTTPCSKLFLHLPAFRTELRFLLILAYKDTHSPASVCSPAHPPGPSPPLQPCSLQFLLQSDSTLCSLGMSDAVLYLISASNALSFRNNIHSCFRINLHSSIIWEVFQCLPLSPACPVQLHSPFFPSTTARQCCCPLILGCFLDVLSLSPPSMGAPHPYSGELAYEASHMERDHGRPSEAQATQSASPVLHRRGP